MELVHTNGFYQGTYVEHSASDVRNETTCVARCQSSVTCAALTWVVRPIDPCVLYSKITGVLQSMEGVDNWVKMPGRFIHPDVGTAPCPVKGFPAGCTWWENFTDSSIHFVSNCDDFPTDCHAAQLSCWGQPLIPLAQVTAAELLVLNRSAGDNYTCAMNPLPKPVPPPPTPNGGPAEMLRTSFALPTGVTIRSATAFVGGVGWMELFINGEPVAPQDKLNPGRTEFDMRLFYLGYDVAHMLLAGGQNAIGVWLGHGWQSMGGYAATAKVYLRIVLDDGSTVDIISSNATWVGTTDGPITSNDIYQGENYDARKEIASWASPGGFAGGWAPAVVLDEFARFNYSMRWQPMPPIRALQLNSPLTVTPVTLTTGEIVYVYDMGQNAAGWARLSVKACPAGTNITMWYSEILCGYGTTRWSPPCSTGQVPGGGEFGTVDQRNYRGNWRDTYTCKGGVAEEVYEPRFTYRGHRFVEVHGFPGAPPTLDALAQRVVHSDVEAVTPPAEEVARVPVGQVAFGDAGSLLDGISHNVRWTLIDNLHSVPEDCDNRNERWGWMADASVSAEADVHYHWMPALYTSWLDSMQNVQDDPTASCAAVTGGDGDTNVVDGQADCAGAVADLTPGHTPTDKPGDPSWMFAYPLVYSYVFRYYGDAGLAARLFPGIQAYVDWQLRMAGRSKTGLLSWFKYGDWLEPGKVRWGTFSTRATCTVTSRDFTRPITVQALCDKSLTAVARLWCMLAGVS